jgi:hypothetical protein
MMALFANTVHADPPTSDQPIEITEPGEFLYIYNDLTYANNNASREYFKKEVVLISVVFDTNTFNYNGPSNDKNGTMVFLDSVNSHGVRVRVPGKLKPIVLKLCKGQRVKINAIVNDLEGNDLSFTATAIELVGPVIEKAPPQKDPIKITADQLWHDFKGNWVDGDEKWYGKIVEVTGFCVGRDDNVVNMIDSRLGIACIMPNRLQKTVDKIQAGQCITVVGVVGHFSAGNVMITAKSLTLSNEKPPVISASDVYTEFQDNNQKASDTYIGKFFSVHGNLVSVLIQSGGMQKLIITLKTDESNNVWCYLPSSTDDNIKNLVEDGGITVVGRIKEFKVIEGKKRLVVEAIHYAADPE